jgi:hypothetical protein
MATAKPQLACKQLAAGTLTHAEEDDGECDPDDGDDVLPTSQSLCRTKQLVVRVLTIA